jgi:hypothetical protein
MSSLNYRKIAMMQSILITSLAVLLLIMELISLPTWTLWCCQPPLNVTRLQECLAALRRKTLLLITLPPPFGN